MGKFRKAKEIECDHSSYTYIGLLTGGSGNEAGGAKSFIKEMKCEERFDRKETWHHTGIL